MLCSPRLGEFISSLPRGSDKRVYTVANILTSCAAQAGSPAPCQRRTALASCGRLSPSRRRFPHLEHRGRALFCRGVNMDRCALDARVDMHAGCFRADVCGPEYAAAGATRATQLHTLWSNDSSVPADTQTRCCDGLRGLGSVAGAYSIGIVRERANLCLGATCACQELERLHECLWHLGSANFRGHRRGRLFNVHDRRRCSGQCIHRHPHG